MHHEGIITPKVLNSPEGNSGRLPIMPLLTDFNAFLEELNKESDRG
jgi:hypothetical protein